MLTTSICWKWAYSRTTACVFSSTVSLISMRRCFLPAATAISMASAVAVVPSYIDAFETSMPVKAVIIDWYSKM